jgi:glycosyltransferase involved in cell wall biosynthesis
MTGGSTPAASPVVSVITPTKNRLRLLSEAIDSVQRQTFNAWEHIVVDDGSEDGTAEEVSQRAAADPRIRYVKRTCEKSGANVCRNIGITVSSGEFIVFLDSDDLLAPSCLAHRVELMQRNLDLDFAAFQSAAFEKSPGDLARKVSDELLGDDLVRFLFFEYPWIITGPIWRRSSLYKLGLFDEALLSWQDIDLHIRAVAQGLKYLRFMEVDHLIRWQFEPTKISIEQRRSASHLEAADEILKKFECVIREGPGMNWVRQRALCSPYFFVAEQWVALENLSAALRCWKKIRKNQLGSSVLHLSGVALLMVLAWSGPGGSLGNRIVNKWKGWMRLRTNPELLAR